MVQIVEFMEKHPKFVRTFAMFWGIVLVVAAAVPTVETNRISEFEKNEYSGASERKPIRTFTLDGCFILETLRLLTDETQWDLNVESQWKLDPVFNRNRVRSCQFDILSDILMLENQVPIVLLMELLAMEDKSAVEEAMIELLRMICDGIIALVHPFNYSLQPNTKEQQTEHRQREVKLRRIFESRYKNLEDYNHILGFFHDFIVDEFQAEKTGDIQFTVPHSSRRRHGHPRETPLHQIQNQSHRQQLRASVAEFYKNGMKFRAYDGVPSSKLRFDKREKTLYLPVVYVSDSTEVILRNLMAIDVYQEKELSIISEYVFLMNSLIQSEEDVALLREKGIIQSSIGTDKEVTDLFNGLSKGVNFSFSDEDEFGQLKISVNGWYRRRTMVQVGEFMEKHPKFMRTFTMFWGVVLVVAAAVPTMVQIFKQLYSHAK
ncbi:putative UPF0481 protein At3g02645 [Cryptomeria japonica]|uniref:putative UPF0481 protein At3g02645 n=1 Tax=Cryptomeria japonica TaxID=3369 RepID=UPI0027DA2953|nr:putative UPF0481 protein At3g02645 [Cryptomeria japonica]